MAAMLVPYGLGYVGRVDAAFLKGGSMVVQGPTKELLAESVLRASSS